MRICVVYDCLYPHTIGGAERWYRDLALRLAQVGHDVTYLTMCQWEKAEPPELEGVRVVAVSPRMALYANGRRRIAPPLVFGLGVLRHLALHGANYDVVHTASFPYFSLLAAGSARPARRYRIVVDWPEVWTRGYWNEYLGRRRLGAVGNRVQRLCVGVRQEAFCFSRLHERRLRAEGFSGPIRSSAGCTRAAPKGRPSPPSRSSCSRVVTSGRSVSRQWFRRWHGPASWCRASGVSSSETGPSVPSCFGRSSGPVSRESSRHPASWNRNASSRRYEPRSVSYCPRFAKATASWSWRRRPGTPSVVVDAPDNAAVELVEDGVNGFVAPSASPEELAEAIVRAHRAGQPLREATASWFSRNADTLSLESSLRIVLDHYGRRSSPCA